MIFLNISTLHLFGFPHNLPLRSYAFSSAKITLIHDYFSSRCNSPTLAQCQLAADTDFFFPFLHQEMERKEKEKQRNGATNLAINGDHLSK